MPVIAKLQAEGFRVWHDEGIDAGAEWPETVAAHLKDCRLFISFISKSYLDSFNCRREIDYAVSKRKDFIAVMLEEVQMTPGMEMQLSSVQFLNLSRTDDKEFYERLFQSELIKPCLAADEETAETPEPQKPPAGKAGGRKKIAVIVGTVILAAGLLFLFGWKLTHITVAGTTYMFNEQYLTIKDASLTPDDTRKLRRFTNLGLLSFENCDFAEDSENNLSNIRNGVRSFHVIDCTGIEDFGWLSGLRSVEWLEIRNSGFDDRSADRVGLLWGMDNIVSIDLSDNKDFSNLGKVMNSLSHDLQQVHVANTGVSSIASLKDFASLRLIDIEGCNVESLEPLSSLKEVTFLDADNNRLKDLTGISGMTSLDTLSAAGNGLVSIDGAADCVNLERIDLSDNNISDISPLVKSRIVIRQLLLDNNDISDMSALKGMSSLKLLSINGNQLEDLSFLEGSDELEVLSGAHNSIRSLGPVSSMKGINALYLSDNHIEGELIFDEDFGTWNHNDIGDGGNIRDIQLQNNKISSVTFNKSLPWSFAVYGNPLEELVAPGGEKGEYAGEDAVEYSEPGTAVFKTGGHTLVIDDFREPIPRTAVFSGVEEVYISWDALGEEMMNMLSGFDDYTGLYLSGCPLDYKEQVEELFSRVSFITQDEMDRLTDEAREKRIEGLL